MSASKKKTKVKVKTKPWNSAKYLKTNQDITDYLEAVLDEGDAALLAHALGVVARAKGMTKIARAAGLGRESLYKSLSPSGNPELATVLKVIQALGLKLKVAA
jgi:probable addiction module antidote protein